MRHDRSWLLVAALLVFGVLLVVGGIRGFLVATGYTVDSYDRAVFAET